MKIVSFDFDEQLVDDFIDLSWEIYKDDPQWIPPSKENLRGQFSSDHPFYEHGKLKNFLAYNEAHKVVGRISAIINDYMVIDGKQIGHVGFFECCNDYSVCKQLLDSCVAYLRQQGIHMIWGPVNFATMYQYRFLTRGFHKPTFYTDLYNHPYYPEFFVRYGFREIKQYYTDITYEPMTICEFYGNARKKFDAAGFTVRYADMSDFDAAMRMLYELIFAALKNNFAFTGMGYAEFYRLYLPYKKLLKDENLSIAYSPENKPVGFFLTFPDFSGNNPNVIIAKMLGVVPEYTAMGVGAGLVHEFVLQIKEKYDVIILSLRIEDNYSRKFARDFYEVYKEYTLYELNIK